MYSPVKVIRQFTLNANFAKFVMFIYLIQVKMILFAVTFGYSCYWLLMLLAPLLLNLKNNEWDKDTMYTPVDDVGKTSSAITSVGHCTRATGLQMSAFLLFTSS